MDWSQEKLKEEIRKRFPDFKVVFKPLKVHNLQYSRPLPDIFFRELPKVPNREVLELPPIWKDLIRLRMRPFFIRKSSIDILKLKNAEDEIEYYLNVYDSGVTARKVRKTLYVYFPPKFTRDSDGKLHGKISGFYFYHGHVVPNQAAVDIPELAEIVLCSNMETRRELIENYGRERFLKDMGATMVDSAPENAKNVGLRGAKLWRIDDLMMFMLELRNSTKEKDGTYKKYFMWINPSDYNMWLKPSVLAAVASTWRDANGNLIFERPEDYDPTVET